MAIVNNHCAGGVKEMARLASLADAAVIRIAMLDMPGGRPDDGLDAGEEKRH